jgi:hypothetical protein
MNLQIISNVEQDSCLDTIHALLQEQKVFHQRSKDL